ncbi:hypothetical protein CONCODRAFT_153912, partial [Conidiobolus coronatus NRRL 28638]
QKFKSFDAIPEGLVIKNINCKKAGIDTDKLKNLSISDFGLIKNNYFSKREFPPVQSDDEQLQLALILHLMLSKLDSKGNQSKFEELAHYIDYNISYLLPLTYIPLLNNLKLNKKYNLWFSFFRNMKLDGTLISNGRLISDLAEDLIPNVISLVNNIVTKRKADNDIDYRNLSIDEDLDFEVLLNIVEEYELANRMPDRLIVNMIFDIAKEIAINKCEHRDYIENRWVAATLKLLLKSNDLKAAYSLYNDQFIKSENSIYAFLQYFGKIGGDKEGFKEFWGEFETNRITPNEWTYKFGLEVYLNMGDLKNVKLILNKLVSQTDVRLDSELVRLVIERLITAEPQNLNYILTIINSSYIDNTHSSWKYDMILISLVEYTKIDQLDHFDKLFNLYVKELYIYYNNLVTSRSKYVEEYNKDFMKNTAKTTMKIMMLKKNYLIQSLSNLFRLL